MDNQQLMQFIETIKQKFDQQQIQINTLNKDLGDTQKAVTIIFTTAKERIMNIEQRIQKLEENDGK